MPTSEAQSPRPASGSGPPPRHPLQASIDLLVFIFGKGAAKSWLGTKSSMFGGRAEYIIDTMLPGDTHYFAISALAPGANHRSNIFFKAGHLIVLDDVGTKLDLTTVELLAPEPSYVIETSSGNFQYGYVLETPESDPRKFQALLQGLRHSLVWGLGGDVKSLVHYVRLPTGTNFKNGFATRLTRFTRKKYPIQDLAGLFGVDLSPQAVGRIKDLPGESAPLTSAALAGDPVLQTLLELDLTLSKSPSALGWFPLRECPWASGHSAGRVDGAAYTPHETGAFKCHHASCENRHMGDFRNWLWQEHETYRRHVFPAKRGGPEAFPPPAPANPKPTSPPREEQAPGDKDTGNTARSDVQPPARTGANGQHPPETPVAGLNGHHHPAEMFADLLRNESHDIWLDKTGAPDPAGLEALGLYPGLTDLRIKHDVRLASDEFTRSTGHRPRDWGGKGLWGRKT